MLGGRKKLLHGKSHMLSGARGCWQGRGLWTTGQCLLMPERSLAPSVGRGWGHGPWRTASHGHEEGTWRGGKERRLWASAVWPQGWPPFPGQGVFGRAQQSGHVCTRVRPGHVHATHSLRDRLRSAHRPCGPGRRASPGVPVRELGLCPLTPSHRDPGVRSAPPPLLRRLQGPRMGGPSLPPPAPPASCCLPGSLPLEGSPWLAEPTVQTRCFPVCIFCAARTHIWDLAQRRVTKPHAPQNQ